MKTQSAKICLNFNFRGVEGGGYSGVVRTESAKICPNFSGGGEFWGSENSKCQDLTKFKILGGGRGYGGGKFGTKSQFNWDF